MSDKPLTRRPIKARDTKWAASLARLLASRRILPNQISIFSVVFSGLAGLCLLGTRWLAPGWDAFLFLGTAAGIQLRLLCNLLDGMVAVEGGFKTKSGEVFNELPDRFSDAIILGCAGYSLPAHTWLPILGWLAAVLAIITAYTRALGASAGTTQFFIGPMAKQQRMAVMTVACGINVLTMLFGSAYNYLEPALIIIVVGCVITIARRTKLVIQALESR